MTALRIIPVETSGFCDLVTGECTTFDETATEAEELPPPATPRSARADSSFVVSSASPVIA